MRNYTPPKDNHLAFTVAIKLANSALIKFESSKRDKWDLEFTLEELKVTYETMVREYLDDESIIDALAVALDTYKQRILQLHNNR